MNQFSQPELDKFFHAYDIRGVVSDGLDTNFYYTLGKALVKHFNAKKLAVGFDMRLESKKFAQAMIEGITESGCDVVNIGEIATEILYFVVGNDLSFDGGIVVTASHNPTGWNGAKIVGHGATAVSQQTGLTEIKEIMRTHNFHPLAEQAGTVSQYDPFPEFTKKILSFTGNTKIRHLSLLIDAGNGIGGVVFNKVFAELINNWTLDVTEMYFEPDGTFPNHTPNPIKEENVREIKQKMADEDEYFDLGIAIDGDADRVFFIDNQGRNPNGIYVGALFARYFAKQTKHPKIIHDTRVIWPLTKEKQKHHYSTLETKPGHSYIKETMRNNQAQFGIELSSHFYHQDFYYADSGFITIIMMLKLLSEGLDLESELDYFYQHYPISGEVNFQVDNPDQEIARIAAEFSDKEIDRTDGISIAFPEWRFNLRKSNTEPLIRLNVEAMSPQKLKEGYMRISKTVKGQAKNTPSHPVLS